MFSTEYYYLVAGLREWTLDSDTKGFDVREIIDEILAELSKSDRAAVKLLYAYYDCENIIARRAQRERHNALGNLSAEQIDEMFTTRHYDSLPSHVAKVVKYFNEADDEDRDEEDVITESFERALFAAYYKDLAASKDKLAVSLPGLMPSGTIYARPHSASLANLSIAFLSAT